MLRIFGIPEITDEITKNVFADFLEEKLDIFVPPDRRDMSIEICRRAEPVNGRYPRAVVVEVDAYLHQEMFRKIRRLTTLEGSKLGIYKDLWCERDKIADDAVKRFGQSFVRIIDSGVLLDNNGVSVCFFSYAQYHEFLEKYGQ